MLQLEEVCHSQMTRIQELESQVGYELFENITVCGWSHRRYCFTLRGFRPRMFRRNGAYTSVQDCLIFIAHLIPFHAARGTLRNVVFAGFVKEVSTIP